MINTAKSFEFTRYEINAEKQGFSFFYKLNFLDNSSTDFCEKISFNEPFNLENIPENLLENVLSSLHIMLGISYYKLYCPKEIKVSKNLSKKQAEFWNNIYRKGLGEFSYKNQLNIKELVNFPFDEKQNNSHPNPLSTERGNSSYPPPQLRGKADEVSKGELGVGNITKDAEKLFIDNKRFSVLASQAQEGHDGQYCGCIEGQGLNFKRKNRSLVGIGGGKDSIVSAELLKSHGEDIKAFLVETQREDVISQNVIKELGIEAFVVKRQMDEKIFTLPEGAYNGHIPISGILAFLGYLTAILYDFSNVIVSNEFSSNFGNIDYNGGQINHQWSKSAEFEALFQEYCKKNLCSNVVYFSLLRQFYEIRIMEMFTKYKKYFHIFSSCNRNFRVNKDRPTTLWCGGCPKCVFARILLSAFLEKDELINIFGKNLYEDENLLPLFADVLGFGTMKPFDCVGTFEESQVAFSMAKEKFKGSFIVRELEGKLEGIEEKKSKVFAVNNALTLPDNFKFYGLKNVLIIGYGKEGKITEEYLKKYFPEIEIGIADKSKDGENYLSLQNDYEFAIKSPGIPKKNISIPYTTATNLFFSKLRNNLKIGITGSKGKSTTSSLIYAIIKESGKKVRLVGNIGNPMLEVLLEPIDEDEIFVIELSSYQLDDIRYSPEIAVITNLFAEHLDYHDGVENYHLAKKNIIKYQNQTSLTSLLNSRDEDLTQFSPYKGEMGLPKSFVVYNGGNENLQKWENDIISEKVDFTKIDLKDVETSLLGEHNKGNIQASIEVARILKIPDEVIKKAIKEFKPLNHRLEFVGEFKGIKFYDDAIATIPEATIEALKALSQTQTIFLGGLDRGYDFSSLAEFISKSEIKNIVFFPDTGEKIENSLKKLDGVEKYNILHTRDMKEAVEFAYKHTSSGKICLLSTASPSYSIWKNFEEKGDEFKKWVRELFYKKNFKKQIARLTF